ATVVQSAAAADPDVRQTATALLAAAQASRGAVATADQTLRQLQSEAVLDDEKLRANKARWSRLALALFSRGLAADPGEPGRWDSTTTGLSVHGAWAAAAGDTTLARRLIGLIRTRSAPDIGRQGFLGPVMVEGWIAGRAGRWQDVLTLL